MKKKIVVFLAGVMMLSLLGGCGDDKAGADQGTTQSQTEQDQSSSGEGQTSESKQSVEAVLLKDVKVEDYVTIGEYKGLEMSFAAKAEFTPEDVTNLALSVYQVRDRAAENGDTVNIDYVGTKDGVAFDGGTASGAQLTLGSGAYIDGFEAGLVGVMPGETVDLNLSFPDPYDNNPDLAGKPVVFTVTVNYIYPTENDTEMTDEGVAAMGYEEYTTVQELQDYCQDYLEYRVENTYVTGQQNAAMTAVLAIAEIKDAPEGLVQTYYNSIYSSLAMQAAQYMMDADTLCGYFYGTDADTYATAYAQESAKQSMVIQYIANAESLNISDEELAACVADFAEKNGVTPEDVYASEDEEMLREYFMFEKVLKFLVDNGVVTETEE